MKYQVKAIKDGQKFTRYFEAEEEKSLMDFLKEKGYFIISIKNAQKEELTFFSSFFQKVAFNDIINFTRQLAMMLNAGLTLIDSLAILKKQTTKLAYLKLIDDIDKELKSGNSFSGALKKYPQYFSNLYIALVKSGEASGKLNDILLRLAENLDKERELKGKITSALIYPAIITLAMIGVMFVMIVFVIPNLLNIYKDFNIDLPFTTKMLIFVSSILTKIWPLILGGIIFLIPLMRRILTIESIRYKIDDFLLKLPVFGRIIQMASLVIATRTISILIASGVQILDGLMIIIDISNNLVYKRVFQQVYKDVEKGSSLGDSLDKAGVFPPILVQMTTVGEETGRLDETLKKISQYFEMESELAIKTAISLIEPAILVFLGVGVGFLVMSVITPIYNLTSSFK